MSMTLAYVAREDSTEQRFIERQLEGIRHSGGPLALGGFLVRCRY